MDNLRQQEHVSQSGAGRQAGRGVPENEVNEPDQPYFFDAPKLFLFIFAPESFRPPAWRQGGNSIGFLGQEFGHSIGTYTCLICQPQTEWCTRLWTKNRPKQLPEIRTETIELPLWETDRRRLEMNETPQTVCKEED